MALRPVTLGLGFCEGLIIDMCTMHVRLITVLTMMFGTGSDWVCRHRDALQGRTSLLGVFRSSVVWPCCPASHGGWGGNLGTSYQGTSQVPLFAALCMTPCQLQSVASQCSHHPISLLCSLSLTLQCSVGCKAFRREGASMHPDALAGIRFICMPHHCANHQHGSKTISNVCHCGGAGCGRREAAAAFEQPQGFCTRPSTAARAASMAAARSGFCACSWPTLRRTTHLGCILPSSTHMRCIGERSAIPAPIVQRAHETTACAL